MTTLVRYITSADRDYYLGHAGEHDYGVWTHDRDLAGEWASEAHAKQYMFDRGYDLPAAQVVYEVVS